MPQDKLTAVRVKQENGEYGPQIPVAAKAENVEYNKQYSVKDVLGTVDITKGPLQDQIQNLVAQFSTEEIQNWIKNNFNFAQYDSSTSYDIGDIVIYENSFYRCKQNNTQGKTPSTESNYWDLLTNFVIDQSLRVAGAAADAAAAGELRKMIIVNDEAIPSDETKLCFNTSNDVVNIALIDDLNTKINRPIRNGQYNNGEQGQLLKTNGNGSTEWVNEKWPTDEQVQQMINSKINRPIKNGQYNNGEQGQLLRTNGDGSTEWVNEGLPRDDQVQAVVDEWMNQHSGRYIVPNESLTYKKLVKGTLNYVTPEMYGAIGNGETDDTAAIQDAVNSGYCVYFDKSYCVYGTINITNSCILIGDKNHFIKQTKNNTNLFMITNAENVIIDSLHLIGVGTDYNPDGSGLTYPYGLKVFGTTESRIKTVYITNCLVEKFGRADISVTYSNKVVIASNVVIGTGEDGSMNVNDNYQFGIHSNNCNNVKIYHNDISYTAQGLYLGKNLNNLIIANNIIHNITGQHGIYSTYANNWLLANNIFQNITYAGMKIQHDKDTIKDSEDIIIEGNVFKNVGQQAVMLTYSINRDKGQTIEQYCVNANISNNIFHGCDSGIVLIRAKETLISNNLYIGTAEHHNIGIGIGDETDQIIIQNNRIMNSSNGIYARPNANINNITLKDNVLKDAGISFQVASSVENLTYINNIADSVSYFPDKYIIGKKQNANIYYCPSTLLDVTNYKTGDIALFNNASDIKYMGAIMNSDKAWVYFGNYLDHVKYIFTINSGRDAVTINEFTAHSEGEHTLIISYSITYNQRIQSAITIGSFTGIPSTLLPSTGTNAYLATSGNDDYVLYIQANGKIGANQGRAGTTYTKTVTLVDGQISN